MAKNILYLSPYFWPEEIGSAPYATELAVWLEEKGHKLQVIAFRPHYPRVEEFGAWSDGARDKESYKGIGISRIAVTARGAGGFKQRIKNDVRFLFSTLRMAVTGKFLKTDVIVAYVPSILTVLGAQLVKVFSGARLVSIVHDIESGLAQSLSLASNGLLLSFMRAIEAFALNRSDQVIVLTEGMRTELRQLGCHRPISVIPIWASLPPEETSISNRPITLMYSGNFGKKQNLDQLIPLIKRLSDEKRSIHVIMQGSGSERTRIEQLFAESGISNTQFRGLVPAEKLTDSLRTANIHLVPQAQNVANYALPSKLFSIMAAGRPFVCIAEKNSPLDELACQSDAGICIPPNDQNRLFDAVVALADNPEDQRTKGANGRAFVLRNMNKEAILNSYHGLIVDGT